MSLKGEDALILTYDYVDQILKGGGALKGQDGFSPIITENIGNTDEDYRLVITTKDDTISTPNLIGKQGDKGDKGDKGDTGEPGPQGIQGESSIAAIVPRGDYDINATPSYVVSDYVTYTDGNTYVCKIDNPTNEPPTDGTINDVYWQLIALRGAKGNDGVTFIPAIDNDGNLSWSNDGGLQNPQDVNLVNIKISEISDNAIKQEADGAYVKKVDADLLEYVNTTQGIEDAPVGHIISHMGTVAPDHYLICDGTEYNIADYSHLAQHFAKQFGNSNYFGGDGVVTFTVPDLRGEFLRGVGTNSHANQGNGSNVGIHQDATSFYDSWIDANSNVLSLRYDSADLTSAGYSQIKDKDKIIAVSGSSNGYKVGLSSIATSVTSARYTSRPTNTSVLYCIKYEPTYYMVNHNTYNGDIIGNQGLKVYGGKVDVDFTKVQAAEVGKGLSTNDYTDKDVELVKSIPGKIDNLPAKKDAYDTGRVWLNGAPIYRRDFLWELTSPNSDGTAFVELLLKSDQWITQEIIIVNSSLNPIQGCDEITMSLSEESYHYMVNVKPIAGQTRILVTGYIEYVIIENFEEAGDFIETETGYYWNYDSDWLNKEFGII